MLGMANLSTTADQSYWHHVALIRGQMRGIHTGYTKVALEHNLPPLSFESILYMTMGDEMGDFAGFVPGEGFTAKEARPSPFLY